MIDTSMQEDLQLYSKYKSLLEQHPDRVRPEFDPSFRDGIRDWLVGSNHALTERQRSTLGERVEQLSAAKKKPADYGVDSPRGYIEPELDGPAAPLWRSRSYLARWRFKMQMIGRAECDRILAECEQMKAEGGGDE